MTGTKDEALAMTDREMDLDFGKADEVLQKRANDVERYNANILRLARPAFLDLLVLNCASLDDINGSCDVLAGIAMTLNDPRLTSTLKTRVAKVRATVTAEAARQKRLHIDEARDVPPLTGKG